MQADSAELMRLCLQGNRLKQTPRTGWVLRGVVNAESVAAHSFGVAYIALLLANYVDDDIDVAKLLSMAVLHDLPEATTGDLPAPVKRFLPAGAKGQMEDRVWQELFAGTRVGENLSAVYLERQTNDTLEAKLLHDADKLDMYLQAHQYEEQQGNRQLAEFWHKTPTLHFSISQALYQHIKQSRSL